MKQGCRPILVSISRRILRRSIVSWNGRLGPIMQRLVHPYDKVPPEFRSLRVNCQKISGSNTSRLRYIGGSDPSHTHSQHGRTCARVQTHPSWGIELIVEKFPDARREIFRISLVWPFETINVHNLSVLGNAIGLHDRLISKLYHIRTCAVYTVIVFREMLAYYFRDTLIKHVTFIDFWICLNMVITTGFCKLN